MVLGAGALSPEWGRAASPPHTMEEGGCGPERGRYSPKVTQRGRDHPVLLPPSIGPSEPYAPEPSGCRLSPPRTRTLAPAPLPLGPQWTCLRPGSGAALSGGRTRLGQARSGRVLCFPRRDDALRQVPDSGTLPPPPRPSLRKRLSGKPDSQAQPRGCGAARRCGGRGEVRVTGRSPNGGHPANRPSGRVPFKASRPER